MRRARRQPEAGRAPVRAGLLQRQCDCGNHTPGGGECEECRKKHELVQRRANPAAPAPTAGVSPVVHRVLGSPGQALDPAVRGFMEERLAGPVSRVSVGAQTALAVGPPGDRYEREADRIAGRAEDGAAGARGPGFDFSRVRVHTGDEAAEAARGLSARAFTVGHHVVFGAGQYAPGSAAGRHLLAHELAHVAQQDGAPGLIQRDITVIDPGDPTPNDPTRTNAEIVESWLDELCPAGNWEVDGTSGVVGSPDRATFCAARPARGQAHARTSGTPTSCRCLCELTEPGSTVVRVHAASAFTVDGVAQDVTAHGEGLTVPDAAGEFHVGASGLELTGIPGAGDTSPLAGANPNQTLRDPAWIIFGHELCGHVRLWSTEGDLRFHSQTPEGDRESVDIENRIRREHSTIADNFGIRRGVFTDAAGNQHDGSVYAVSAGETLSGIARRCGLTTAQILTHMFRENGDAVTAATRNTVRAGERLMIEGIQWHEVIRGETMTSIATMWGIPLASLRRANPQVADPNRIRVGQRLLVPAT